MFLKIYSFIMALIISIVSFFGGEVGYDYRVTAPIIQNKYTREAAVNADNASFYIATNGNDDNDGSFDAPFLTFDRAKQAVKALDKTKLNEVAVAVKAGEYRVDTIKFSSDDSGTAACPIRYCAYGDGEVVINGGVTLDSDKFVKVTDKSVLSRLSSKAKENVVCCDLFSLGVTKEDYGKIYAIGTYNTAHKYTGDTVGPIYSELFVNDNRMTLARYPNEGFLLTEEVVKTGEGRETNGNLTANPNWDSIVNPESDVYRVNKKLAARINSWKTLEDVWAFGFWKYDWADASSPIGLFDYENRTFSPKYVSTYGTKKGAPYYFFNVLEELDSPGEWYLDRENGVIYLYSPDELKTASIDLTLSVNNIINGKDANYITFESFTLKGTRSDAVNFTGNNITFKNCLVKNIAGNAIILNGKDNTVVGCEITHTGKGGILLDGGDRETLTPGNNTATCNLIHDWSEIYQTYQPAVTLSGVGNVCSHNEMYNSPHEAITYSGNNHLIEYNVIHDVCLLSDDAAAVYAGRHWDWYGDVIRYNLIYNLGSDGHSPSGIYFDDALSGQTAYGNILINIPDNAFLIGGGRDIVVKNNVIINPGKRAVYYDQRVVDGLNGGWFTFANDINGGLWQGLLTSPWQTDAWKRAYPQMQKYSSDFADRDNPDFAPNPAYSDISGNLIVDVRGELGKVEESVTKFSNISDNPVYYLYEVDKLFNCVEKGDYTLKSDSEIFDELPQFEKLPIEKMGVIKVEK